MDNWIVSFSSGERISESSLRHVVDNNQRVNPWQYVLNFLKKNPGKYITHIELIVNGRAFHSPTTSDKSKFVNDVKPEDFWICHRTIGFIGGGPSSEFISFSYRIGDYRYFHWVNKATNESYVEIKNQTDTVCVDINNAYMEIRDASISGA